MAIMTFEEMYQQAKALGYSLEQMKQHCRGQIAQRERVPSWQHTVQQARECLKWLEAKPIS